MKKLLLRLRRSRRQKSLGQSIVEFTILLPVILIMLSGLVEFGFLLNQYLDVIDSARETARFGANLDPLSPDDGIVNCNNTTYFYRLLPCMAERTMGDIILDYPNGDDVVLSSFAVSGGTVQARFPDADGWSYSQSLGNPGQLSGFTTAEIEALLDPAAPRTGFVLVELYYNYNMLLKLPWITAFVPDPVTLYAYSIMPNVRVEPTPTP